MTDAVKFGSLITEFDGVPYKWGQSSLVSSDCSGTVCYVLNLIYDTCLRFCADELYRKFFTINDEDKIKSDECIKALFFIDPATGRAVHVAGCIQGEFFLNMSSIEPCHDGHIRKRSELIAMYSSFRVEERALDVYKWVSATRKSA